MTDQGDQAETANIGNDLDGTDTGDITPMPESDDPLADHPDRPREEPLKVTVKRRLEAEGRWAGQIEIERNEMMRLVRKRFKAKAERQDWVYAELDRLYPPLPKTATDSTETAEKEKLSPVVNEQIQGLGAIPESWPELPSNASLSAEVGWCQANRLRIVTDKPGGATTVHLGRALSPAPSWAALGWLETSIRSYAKYVDVASKATSSDDGEAGVMRRERMAIEEVDALLAEMRPDRRDDD
jgi:hypothetical protein